MSLLPSRLATSLFLLAAFCGPSRATTVVCVNAVLGTQFRVANPQALPDPIKELAELRRKLNEKVSVQNRAPFLFSIDLAHRLEIWSSIESALSDAVGDEPAHYLLETSTTLQNAIETDFSAAWVKRLEATAKKLGNGLIRKPKGSLHDEYAIVGMVEILRRIENARRRAEESKAENEFGKQKESDEKEPKKLPKPEPFYPSESANYHAEHVNTDVGRYGPFERDAIVSVNVGGVVWFYAGFYSSINARTGDWAKQVLPSPEVYRRDISVKRILEVSTLGRKGEPLPLFLPDGFEPHKSFSNRKGSVALSETGTWLFSSQDDKLTIPLVQKGNRVSALSPTELAFYLQSTGVRPDEWEHAPLQAFLSQLTKFTTQLSAEDVERNVKIAQLLAKAMSKLFDYETVGTPGLTPLEHVKRGKLQCSTSLTLLLSLLRELYQIPCRLRTLVPGHSHPTTPGFSHVISPAIGHVVLEVADAEGGWHRIDSTPEKRDAEPSPEQNTDAFYPNASGEDGPSGDGDGSLPADKKGTGQGKRPGEGGSPSRSNSKMKGQPGRKAGKGKSIDRDAAQNQAGEGAARHFDEILNEVQARRQKAQEAAQAALENVPAQEQSPAEETQVPQNVSTEAESELLASKAKSGGVPMDPITRRFLEGLIAQAIAQDAPGEKKILNLSLLKSTLSADDIPGLDTMRVILGDAVTTFQGQHPTLGPWTGQIGALVRAGKLREASDSLNDLIQQLSLALSVMDQNDRAGALRLLDVAKKAQAALNKLSTKDAKVISIADEMFKVMGRFSRTDIKRKYGFDKIGQNAGTEKFARALMAKKHPDLRLRALLASQTDFVVHPLNIPRHSLGRSPMESLRPRPMDLLMSDDPREALRARSPRLDNPDWTAQEAARYGMLPVQRMHDRVPLEEGSSSSAEQGVLVLVWDTSGSMNGNRATFVQEFLKAVVDRAGVGSDGNTLNNILFFIPFGGHVGTPIEISTVSEAEKAVSSNRLFGNSGSGTDITGALTSVPAFLKKRWETDPRFRKSCKKVTTVIFTDGDDNVDKKTVRTAFSQIGKGREIVLVYVATGNPNADLLSLTKESNQAGANVGLFFPWSDGDIENILREANSPFKDPRNSFWNESKNAHQSLSTEDMAHFARLTDYSSAAFPKSSEGENAVKRLKKQLEIAPLTKRQSVRRFSKHQMLYSLRTLLQSVGPNLTKQQRHDAVAHIARRWDSLVGWEMDEAELAELHWIVNWIETGSAFRD